MTPISNLEAPCHRCTDRHVTCHTNCERYLEFKKTLEKKKEELMEMRKKEMCPRSRRSLKKMNAKLNY